MSRKLSVVHLSVGPRQVRAMRLDRAAVDTATLADLAQLGIGMDAREVGQMMAAHGYAMDAGLVPGLLPGSIPTPVQFLQEWLPGFVHLATQARKIDELLGMQTVGSWEDEEIVQGSLELTGKASIYGDQTNIPLSSWNPSFERRTVVRFEEGLRVGKLEEARAGRVNINSSAAKREAAALALDIQRNRVGFFGYNSGVNLTYGLLNDPGLPAYVTVPNGAGGQSEWATKTFLEITADLRTSLSTLRSQSGDTIDPEQTDITLGVASNAVDYLTITSEFGNSVRAWLKETFPRVRVVSVPEFNGASGGENVMYLYAEQVQDNSTDDGRVIAQLVPSKFQLVGVEQGAKAYVEDFSNATAGVLVKRPYAIVRRVGI